MMVSTPFQSVVEHWASMTPKRTKMLKLLPPLSRSRWSSQALRRFQSSQDHLSLFSRETCISTDFQLRKSTSLFLSPWCLLVVTSFPRFLTSGVLDTSESLGHFAESTLLSHDTVSDALSWSCACIFPVASGTGIDARGLSATRLRHHVRHEYE